MRKVFLAMLCLAISCTTALAGEIYGTQVSDDTLVTTAVQFDHTQVRGARIKIGEANDS